LAMSSAAVMATTFAADGAQAATDGSVSIEAHGLQAGTGQDELFGGFGTDHLQ
jgi:hypothetical protein